MTNANKSNTAAVNLNMDLSQSVIIEAANMEWSPSPLKGVVRRRLEREDAEQGHATSIVRYDPGSSFNSHTHGAGEEYLVLEGTFSDQSGDYSPGYYVRNPPGSSHAPFSEPGCTIFVKLCQMQPAGEPQVNIDTKHQPWRQIKQNDHLAMPLFENEHETVTLNKMASGASINLAPDTKNREILILEGELQHQGQRYGAQSWFRFAKGEQVSLQADQETLFWKKAYTPSE